MQKGFTLIELLVVVLIIGILASVALPQYQKAVRKSKLAKIIALIKPFADAEELYYMSNGKYTPSVEDLDIGFPPGDTSGTGSDKGVVRYSNGTLDLLVSASYVTGGSNAAIIFYTKNDGFIIARFLQQSSYPNVWVCVDTGNSEFCKYLGGAPFGPGVNAVSGTAYYLPL